MGYSSKITLNPLILTTFYLKNQVMDAILKKMNFKEGMKIKVWNAPQELNHLVQGWKYQGFLADDSESPNFVLAFVTTEDEVKKVFPEMAIFCPNDEIFWMAYPKGSSKKYKPSINRDSGWKIFGDHDFETVRAVAIDADWSALRFRRIRYIKTMTRQFSTKDQ